MEPTNHCAECGQPCTKKYCGTKCRVAAFRRQQRASSAGEAASSPSRPEKASSRPVSAQSGVSVAELTEHENETLETEEVVERADAVVKARIWPRDLDEAEVRTRLHRIRGYNESMRREGLEQHCASEGYVRERLAEVGESEKLLKLVFGR